MTSGEYQRVRALIIQQILLDSTDEDHLMGTPSLLKALEGWSIEAERKTLYRDLDALRSYGVDVQCRKGKNQGWFIGTRRFQLAELKLLVDAVQSCKFITKRKSDELIRKLEGMTSIHQARQLQRQVYVGRRIKTMNESVYYTIDKLHVALAGRKAVTFRYFQYNVCKEKVFHREGRRYTVYPYGLIWDNGNYYLVGRDASLNDVRHYRVDKMSDLAVTCLQREEAPIDMAAYSGKHFGMFRGREGQVRLRFPNHLVGVVLDRFGQEVTLLPDGDAYFAVTVEAVVSPQFFGWLFGLGSQVKILSPGWAAEEFRAQLAAMAETAASAEEDPDEGTAPYRRPSS